MRHWSSLGRSTSSSTGRCTRRRRTGCWRPGQLCRSDHCTCRRCRSCRRRSAWCTSSPAGTGPRQQVPPSRTWSLHGCKREWA
jgi:hypothetical protein